VIFGALLFAWMTLPVPQTIGRVLFLDKSGSSRSLHVLGFVNVSLVVLFLSLHRMSHQVSGKLRRSAMLSAAVFATVFPLFLLVNAALANFLTASQVIVAALYITILAVAIAENRFRLLALFLVVPQVVVFGLVNPIDRGLRIVESSPLFQFMRSRPELLRGRWIVYSMSLAHPGFFNAVGCEVVNGLDYVPDLASLSVFAPTGVQREVINRSVWLLAEPKYDDDRAAFEDPRGDMLIWHVSPLDPRLRRIGVRFAAFVHRPPAHVAARLGELSADPISGFWLYEIPERGLDNQG
jgi:hypothetical protein